MPKTRAYTREELQSLRRADLQRLCKTYDIKANLKSDALVDILAAYFTSPAYLAPPRSEPVRSRPPSRLNPPTRPLHGPNSRAPSRAQPIPPVTRPHALHTAPSTARIPVVAAATSSNGPTVRRMPVPSQARPRPNSRAAMTTQPSSRADPPIPPPTEATANASSSNPGDDDVALLRAEVAQLRGLIAQWDEGAILQSLEKKMEERINAAVAKQMEVVKQQEEALVIREQALADAWLRLEATREEKAPSNGGDMDEHSPSAALLKRKERESDLPQLNLKRPRMPSGKRTPPHSSSALASEAPSTPDSQLRRSTVPRTPSPPRGPSRDHTMTPSAANLSPRGPIPNFATTHKPPGEVTSPTLDRPDRPARKGGLASIREGHKQHTRRKPSQAHIDLSAITESESEPESGPSRGRPPFLGSISIPDRGTVTPPALSPSPAIGGDNFSYTPLPPPFTRTAPSSASSARSGLHVQQQPTRFSPAREYMNIALNGLSNPNDSPSALATPSTRTMLGTERFRDTRFADEPVVSWTSPRVDFGQETPMH